MENWFTINNPETVISPGLLIYPNRVASNIDRMIAIAGDVNRLRPHVKTHKLPELIAVQVGKGIKKFKCATIAEAEMVAGQGGEDILLAYQPVGPSIQRLITLIKTFPKVRFSVIIDHPRVVQILSDTATDASINLNLYVDIDDGMHRTGVASVDDAIQLIQSIVHSQSLSYAGLHVYDGHLHDSDPVIREAKCLQAFEFVGQLTEALKNLSINTPNIIAGGTPTFPIHAKFPERELSPGTTILWDMGYSSSFQDLNFLHAAILLSRIVSNPQKNVFCLDLGTKSMASEMAHPRVHLQNIGEYQIQSQSEEHLVIRVEDSQPLQINDIVYGIPTHICPTVALYDVANVVDNHVVIDQWEILARRRKLNI